MTTVNDLTAELQELLPIELNIQIPDAETDLIKTGIIDSFGLVNLLFLIERRWGIKISIDQLELDHFRTVKGMAAFIETAQSR
jgi:acyl carrier protein